MRRVKAANVDATGLPDIEENGIQTKAGELITADARR